MHQMIFFPLHIQEALFSTQQVLFFITSTLNAVSLFCLLKETPQNQAAIRNHLLFIQAMVTVTSVFQDILFKPIPLFPAIAGYCVGFLCKAGICPHTLLGFYMLFLVTFGLAVVACVFFRHQTIISTRSRAKLSPSSRITIQTIVAVTLCSTPIVYGFYPFDTSKLDAELDNNPHNLSWARNRGPFFIHERNREVFAMIYGMLFNISVCAFSLIILFSHMFYELRYHARSFRSFTSTTRIRRSIIVLFVQIIVPMGLIVLPAYVMFVGLACDCVPFEICVSAYFILPLHPLTHNIILLSITPAYRQFILSFCQRSFGTASPASALTFCPNNSVPQFASIVSVTLERVLALRTIGYELSSLMALLAGCRTHHVDAILYHGQLEL